MGNVREAVRRIDNAIEYEQKSLSLYGLGLTDTEFPNVVRQIPGLTKLDLSGNQLSSLPNNITQLIQLTELDVSGNQISTLPDSIAQLTRVITLNLSRNRLSELPDCILRLSQLATLNLSENRLSTFPDCITQLTHLSQLDLSANQLTMLPNSIGQLGKLTALDLSVNQLTALPDSIVRLIHLTTFKLSANPLETLPDYIGALTKLTSLDFHCNQITMVPDSIGNLTQLTTLELSGNELTTLPESFVQLKQLITLDLSGNHLPTLPTCICQLTQLSKLSLEANKITTLPDSIGQLGQLDDLNLGFNQLSTLPNNIAQLFQLTKLDLSANKINALPESIGQLSQLSTICLKRSRLTRLPKNITFATQLTILDLADNQITTLPDSFGQLNQLRKFDLTRNELTALPDSIGQLTQLTTLILENNKLTTLPDSIGQLTQLTKLDLERNRLKTLPDSIGGLTQLTKLKLNSNQLTTLPDSIGNLSQLAELDIYSNQLTTLPAGIAQLTQLSTLNLNQNEITAFPDCIGQLFQLTALDLRHNNLTTLPDNMTQLTQLTNLELGFNELDTLPDHIGQLSQLTDLSLSCNQLTTLPDIVTKLSKLETLYLNGNQITSLPKSINQLTKLNLLILSANQLQTLPDNMSQLTQLTSLYLDRNQLCTLPDNLSELTQLTTLDLSDNRLTLLPESIGQLSQLNLLNLGNNHLTTLPNRVTQLSKLDALDLRNNQFTKFPVCIMRFSNLTTLSLENNQLTTLPENLVKLTQLTSINLSFNQLTELPDNFAQLTKLRQLDLSNNQLATFPNSISHLTQLHPRQLNLRFNPFTSFPASVALLVPQIQYAIESYKIAMLPDEAFTAIKQYQNQYITHTTKGISGQNPHLTYRELTNFVKFHAVPAVYSGADKTLSHKQQFVKYKPGQIPKFQSQYRIHQPFNRATLEQRRILKLNIVGNPCAGKTTLFNQLAIQCKPDFEALPTGMEDRTIGLNVFPDYQFRVNNDTYSCNIWDYGGQRIQYMTHHYLLSSNALFVLIIDADKAEDNTDYWMSIIHQLAKHSPIMIVYNQKIEGEMPQVNVTPYRVRYGANITLELCNIKNKHAFATLLKKIQQQIIEFDYPSIPNKWWTIENALQQISVPYVELDELFVIFETHGLIDAREQHQFIDYLRRIGSILYYDEADLKNWVFIRPEWVTRAIYHIFTHTNIEDNKGVFSKDWLHGMWKERKYTGNDINLLEKLLLHRYFEVCYSLDEKQTKYIMPLWLPHEAPGYSPSESYLARYRYQYAFLPYGFISHLIIRFHAFGYLKKIDNDDHMWHWRKGLLLEHKEGEAEIVQTGDDYRDANITVTYRGNATNVTTLMSIVSTEFDRLHEQFTIYNKMNTQDKNPNYVTIAIECPHCVAIGKDSPQYHKLFDLINEAKDSDQGIYQSNFTCSTCKTEIVPEKLVEGNIITVTEENSIHNEHRKDIATLMCYRHYIESYRLMEGKNGRKLSQEVIGKIVGIDKSAVNRMLRRPMIQDKLTPSDYAYDQLLEKFNSDKKSFDNTYSSVIELLENSEPIFQKLQKVDTKNKKDIEQFNTIFNGLLDENKCSGNPSNNSC